MILQHFFQFINKVFKGFHGHLHRLWGSHIYSGYLQKLHRIVGRSALEEFYIILASRFTFFKDFGGNRSSRRIAGSVLIYIESAVEVRYSRPFVFYLSVVFHSGTEVKIVELIISVIEPSCSQNAAFFYLFMSQKFKLCEHGLAE